MRSETVTNGLDDQIRAMPGVVQTYATAGSRGAGVVLLGPDITVLDQLAGQVTDAMRGLPGVVEVQNPATQQVPELGVQINRAKAAELGITAQQIGTTISTLIAGSSVSNPSPAATRLPPPRSSSYL